ncbi:MAG: CapA family protein [Chlorobi bacterium]|nr:CapA family protein [Chlorobiota bacterium]
MAVGDIMLGTLYPSIKYLPPNNDCSFLMAEVNHILNDADVTFGNLEGTFCGDTLQVKKCKNPKVCYRFCMPDHFVNCLKDAGFDLMSIANNHIYDFGYSGLKNTMKVLSEAGIKYAGVVSHPWDTLHLPSGIVIGFTAFSPNRGTLNINNYDLLRSVIDTLEKLSDIIIVSFHGGAEGSKYTHVPREQEIFLGEKRGNVYEFAHKAIDFGADVVIGHGPHVPRAFELYKDKFIAYSLGNFATYKRFNLSGPNGIAPIVKIYVDTTGKFLKAEITSIYQDEDTGVHIDSLDRAFKLIEQLTKEDFPETPLKFHIPQVIPNKN